MRFVTPRARREKNRKVGAVALTDNGIILSEDGVGEPVSPLDPGGHDDSARQPHHPPQQQSIGHFERLERPLVVQHERVPAVVIDLPEVIKIAFGPYLRKRRIEVAVIVRQRPSQSGIKLPAGHTPG